MCPPIQFEFMIIFIVVLKSYFESTSVPGNALFKILMAVFTFVAVSYLTGWVFGYEKLN